MCAQEYIAPVGPVIKPRERAEAPAAQVLRPNTVASAEGAEYGGVLTLHFAPMARKPQFSMMDLFDFRRHGDARVARFADGVAGGDVRLPRAIIRTLGDSIIHSLLDASPSANFALHRLGIRRPRV